MYFVHSPKNGCGIKVAVLLEPPVFEAHVPRTTALHEWRGFPTPTLTSFQHNQFNEDYAEIVTALRGRVPKATLIDPIEEFLNTDGTIQFRDTDGILLFRDEHHLTPRGVARIIPKFRDFFNQHL